MVTHQCSYCSKTFQKKSNLDRHLNKKNSCIGDDNPNLKCKHCGKHFCRKDSLNRHIKTIHTDIINQTKKVNVNGDHNNVHSGTGNQYNNLNINCIIPYPYGYSKFDSLTAQDMLRIFFSESNPLTMIINETHLNPLTPEFHNVGITDLRSGRGCFFSGDAWNTKSSNPLINDMLNHDYPDLLKISDELKKNLPEASKKDIDTKMINLQPYIKPVSVSDFQSQKKFINTLKQDLYNNRHLVKDAIKKSGKTIINGTNNKTMETPENETLKKLTEVYNNNIRILGPKRELAKNLLQDIDEIHGSEYESIIKLMNDTTDVNRINTISRLINKAYCFGSEINNSVIENQIEKETEIDEFLFGNQK